MRNGSVVSGTSGHSGNWLLRKYSRPEIGRNQAAWLGLCSNAPPTTQLWTRKVLERLGQRAVYSWKVQVPQTFLLLQWTLELFYRHFKQSFGRRKLRSHQGANAEVEAVWSLLGLCVLCLHTQVELAGEGVPAARVSVAGLLDAYRSAMREYRNGPEPGESLRERLSLAVIDNYERSSKSSRDYPRKKQTHAIGPPEVRTATKVEIEIAKEIKDQHETRLTA